jgi:hypothetical protein
MIECSFDWLHKEQTIRFNNGEKLIFPINQVIDDNKTEAGYNEQLGKYTVRPHYDYLHHFKRVDFNTFEEAYIFGIIHNNFVSENE